MASEQQVPGDAKLAFTTLLILGSLASFIDNGVIGWIIGPICLLLAWFCIFRAPLRNTMLVLIMAGLMLENPSEGPASSKFATPWFSMGALMLVHLKAIIGGWMFFSGMVVFLRGRNTRNGALGTPKPMIRLAQLSYAAILMAWWVGKWHGGETSYGLWQMDRVMYLPTIFLLCQAAFTSAKDYLSVGKAVLAASVIRSCLAIYVRLTIPAKIDPETGENSLPYATTHNDSMLFAVGSVILVSLMLQRAGRKYTRWIWLFGPILIGGMLANNRRIVWVEIILVFATVYLMTDTNSFKRKLNRAMLAMVPIVGGYVAAGWGSTAGVFKPVQVIRSAVDSSADASTAWRDLENFNLVFTSRNFPLFGLGYGQGFWEVWPMPVVDYDLERYVPHNSILGLYCYYGFAGAAGITLLWVGGVFFAIRSYHFCKAPLEKAAALGCLGAILVYYLQCFGDMGLGSWTGVFLVAPSIAIATKLAVSSGAWDMRAPVGRAARRGFAAWVGIAR
jgi:hypothetical protein